MATKGPDGEFGVSQELLFGYFGVQERERSILPPGFLPEHYVDEPSNCSIGSQEAALAPPAEHDFVIGPLSSAKLPTTIEPKLLTELKNKPGERSWKFINGASPEESSGRVESSSEGYRPKKKSKSKSKKQSKQPPEAKQQKKGRGKPSISTANRLINDHQKAGKIALEDKPTEIEMSIPQAIAKLEKELAEYEAKMLNIECPEDCSEENTELWVRKEKNRVSAQITRHKKAIAQLKGTLHRDKLVGEKNKLAQTVQELTRANQELMQNIADLADKSTKLEESGVRTKSELEEKSLAIEALAKLNQELTQKVAELNAASRNLEQKEQQIKFELENKYSAIVLELGESKKIIAALVRANEINTDSHEIERLNSQNATLKEQNTDLLNRLSGYLTSKQAAEVVLQTDKTHLQTQYYTLLNEFEHFKEAQKQKAREENDKQAEQQAEIAALKTRIADLKYDVQGWDRAVAERDWEIYHLHEQIQYLEANSEYPVYPDVEPYCPESPEQGRRDRNR